MPVHEKKICHRVIGDKEIHPAVVVDIRRDDSPRLSQQLANAALTANISKRPVSVVMEEPARCRLIDAGAAIIALSGL